jgi:hypothetical protein
MAEYISVPPPPAAEDSVVEVPVVADEEAAPFPPDSLPGLIAMLSRKETWLVLTCRELAGVAEAGVCLAVPQAAVKRAIHEKMSRFFSLIRGNIGYNLCKDNEYERKVSRNADRKGFNALPGVHPDGSASTYPLYLP